MASSETSDVTHASRLIARAFSTALRWPPANTTREPALLGRPRRDARDERRDELALKSARGGAEPGRVVDSHVDAQRLEPAEGAQRAELLGDGRIVERQERREVLVEPEPRARPRQ